MNLVLLCLCISCRRAVPLGNGSYVFHFTCLACDEIPHLVVGSGPASHQHVLVSTAFTELTDYGYYLTTTTTLSIFKETSRRYDNLLQKPKYVVRLSRTYASCTYLSIWPHSRASATYRWMLGIKYYLCGVDWNMWPNKQFKLDGL